MSSTANPNPWSSSATYKDCSQGICSIYCPQWCYIVFPPPPPFRFGDESGTDFSPLIIAVLGILASVFIMVSYYTFISKYCRRRGHDNTNVDSNENCDETNNEAWQGTTSGLDETLIKSITVYKYKKGDGLIEGTDCSVCLSEFEEYESLRLLPECNHAFHLPCIDTWLKSHPSCPLCRANISSINALPNQRAAPAQETQHDTNVSHVHVDPYRYRNDAVLVIQYLETSVHEMGVVSIVIISDNVPKIQTDLIRGMYENKIETTQDHGIQVQPIRRSVSLNSSVCQDRVSIADMLHGDGGGGGGGGEDDDEIQMENIREESGVFELVRNPLAIRRTISTGTFMFTGQGKGRHFAIPN
ncbi:LOW QUALITY PROTEIN: zf-RING_2 domain-containing protein, partial [Cephalotus follicularis]